MNTFEEKVKKIVNNEYTVLGEYINSDKKILMRHNSKVCNFNEWEVRPTNFISGGTRCPICSTKKRDILSNSDLCQKILSLYESLSVSDVAKELNIAKTSVKKVLLHYNINIRGTFLKTDPDIIKNILKEYIPGNNINALSEKYNIPVSTIMYHLKTNNIKTSKRKYSINESYFEKIDNQDKAYILGFLMADGCVSTSSSTCSSTNRLIISISKKDRQVLEYINDKMDSSYPIVDYIPVGSYSTNEMSKIIINSIKICKDLEKLGIVERKTGYEIFPDINKELKPHFLRGFIDGDGYIKKNRTIGICSNKKMLEDIVLYLQSTIEIVGRINIKKDNRDKPLWYVTFNTISDSKRIGQLIYKDAIFYLERKFNNLTL